MKKRGCRAGFDDPAAHQKDNIAGEAPGLADVMGRHQDAGAIGLCGLQDGFDFPRCPPVQIGAWLVQKQDLRVADQRTCEGKFLLFAARKLAGGLIQHVPQTDFIRPEFGALTGFFAPHTVHGLALWWVCTLAPGVDISTAPDAAPTHWDQVYLPLLEAITLQQGDALQVTLTSDTRPEVGLRLQWRVTHQRAGKRISEQSLDSFRGRLQA